MVSDTECQDGLINAHNLFSWICILFLDIWTNATIALTVSNEPPLPSHCTLSPSVFSNSARAHLLIQQNVKLLYSCRNQFLIGLERGHLSVKEWR